MTFVGRKARRYARALYSLAREQQSQETLVAELTQVNERFAKVPELGQVLAHRRIPADRKLALLELALAPAEAEGDEGEAPAPGLDLTRYFLKLLVRNGRIALLAEVVQALRDMLDIELGVMRAVVTTAVPLLKGEREMVIAKLQSHTGANRVEIDCVVNKKVVAGVLIHVGDHVIDATVRTYLDTMRERLKQIKVGEFADAGFLSVSADGDDNAGPSTKQ
jgi:F-type H+-transporting ATPase subunit delta